MHWSTHSSQIYTFGPAISLRTSCCVLLQKEHLRFLDLFFCAEDHMFSTNPT